MNELYGKVSSISLECDIARIFNFFINEFNLKLRCFFALILMQILFCTVITVFWFSLNYSITQL